jgi:hypothetical protein
VFVHAEHLPSYVWFLCRLYNAGLQPKLARLHQKVNYPVARGTPMLASMVKWDHSMEWSVASFSEKVSTYMYLTLHILRCKDNKNVEKENSVATHNCWVSVKWQQVHWNSCHIAIYWWYEFERQKLLMVCLVGMMFVQELHENLAVIQKLLGMQTHKHD